MILPGNCQGDLTAVVERARGVPVESGPEDLRDLPRHFGQSRVASRPATAAMTSRSLPRSTMHRGSSRDELIRQAEQFHVEGADVIDLGCDPGTTWAAVGDAVRALRDQGMRVSIDTFDPVEARLAASGGSRACPEREREQPGAGRRLGRGGGGDSGRARLARGA